jgi:hypothetical protein
MIPITPEIIGPGIEEDYQDALERIEKLLRVVPDLPDNDSPGGRFKYELLWLKQEITAGRLPLPVERGWVGTIRSVFAEAWLTKLPGFDELCSQLLTVLDYGLIKPRHYPVLAALIDDAVNRVPVNSVSEKAQTAIKELNLIRSLLLEKVLVLPLPRPEDWPGVYTTRWSREAVPHPTAALVTGLHWMLTTGARPKECRKGPLSAPNPEPLHRIPRPIPGGAA